MKKFRLTGFKYLFLVLVIASFKVQMKYIIPFSAPIVHYDKILLALTGIALLYISYIRCRSFKNGRIYFFLYWITAVPAEVILATRPYEPPKYMLQILNISSLLCFVVVILLTVKNSNISKTTPDS